MIEDVTIRQATLSDIDDVIALTRAAYEGYIPLLARAPTPMQKDYGESIVASDVWLLAVDGVPCAAIVLETQDKAMLVYSIVVHPDHQGKGLGQRLLAFAKDRAHAVGRNAMRLCTSDKMARNLAIYAAFGYHETGREEFDFANSPTVVWMTKEL